MKAYTHTFMLLVLASLSLLSLTDCRSLDQALLKQGASFGKSVKPLRVIINTASIETCVGREFTRKMGVDESRLNPQAAEQFNRLLEQVKINTGKVLRQNLRFDSAARRTSLSIILRKHEFRQNLTWSVLSGLTICVLNLFGFPVGSNTSTIYLEAGLLQPDGKVLKTYTATGSDTEYIAAYWGYGLLSGDSFEAALYRSLQRACQDLRVQLERDSENINKMIR